MNILFHIFDIEDIIYICLYMYMYVHICVCVMNKYMPKRNKMKKYMKKEMPYKHERSNS